MADFSDLILLLPLQDRLGLHDKRGISTVRLRSGPAIMNEARIKVERAKYFTRQKLYEGAARFKERMIRERLSAVGDYRKKLPIEAGLRTRTGKLKKSLRTTVTGGGTQGDRQKLSGKIGGGEAWYALVHERSGRLQFQRVFDEERAKTLQIIAAGVRQILGTAGNVTAGAA